MDTWLLALDCLINAAIVGILVYEYKRPAPVEVRNVVRTRGPTGSRARRGGSSAVDTHGDQGND